MPIPGIPPHIPLAYGLKGHSFLIGVMKNLIENLCDSCLDHNINVHCETYGGQFLNLVRFSKDGWPLTGLAFLQMFLKEICKWTKGQCISYILYNAMANRLDIDLGVTPQIIESWNRQLEFVQRRNL